MRRGVGPATATAEVASSASTPANVAEGDNTASLDGQGHVLDADAGSEDEAEWPYDWRKQLRAVFVVFREGKLGRGNP